MWNDIGYCFCLVMLQMSIIQIMIDNYVDIFGDEDHIICDNNKKRSNDLKMSVNTADKSAVIKKKAIDGHSGKP